MLPRRQSVPEARLSAQPYTTWMLQPQCVHLVDLAAKNYVSFCFYAPPRILDIHCFVGKGANCRQTSPAHLPAERPERGTGSMRAATYGCQRFETAPG